MASEIGRLIDMLGCGNTTPQERIRWAHSIVDLARADGTEQKRLEIRKVAIPIIPGAHIRVDDKGFVFMDPSPLLDSTEDYGAQVFLVGLNVLAPKETP